VTDVSSFTNLAAALAVSAVAAALKKAEEYRERAQQCDERASHASDFWTRQQLQDCARQWRRLAAQAERRVRWG
jgi:hypothetical protein